MKIDVSDNDPESWCEMHTCRTAHASQQSYAKGDEWSEPLIVCAGQFCLLGTKVRSHVTKAWRHQHSPELPEADHIPSILRDASPKEGICVAFLAAKYVSGLADLNALIVHGAPPN